MNKVITTAILTLGLLQGASTAYAAFGPEKFEGHYGGVFFGDVYIAQDVAGEDIVLSAQVGTATFKHIGEADGVSDYSGRLRINTTIEDFPVLTGQLEDFTCSYVVDSTDGQVDLSCQIDNPDSSLFGFAELQCVLFTHSSYNHKHGDLDCVGILTIPSEVVGDPFLVVNVSGEIDNRD